MMAAILRQLEKENRNTSEEKLVKALYIEEDYVKELITKTMPDVKIDKVEKVNNNFLEGMYLLTKEEFQVRKPNVELDERNLLHATSQANVLNIIRNNLSRLYTTRGSYGKGVYFSDEAELANKICNPSCGNKRAIIVCKVIVGSKWVLHSNPRNFLPQDKDTGLCYNDKVFVKFCDQEFLPLFVAYYNYPPLPEVC